MEEEQAQAEAMSEEREEGRVPEERAQAASASGASPCPRHQLAVQDIGEGENHCWWLLLGYKEHEKADKDWNTVIKNRNEWPADLDWLKVLNLLSRQEKDEDE